jgi:transcription-repair coupling factor (superfamily II helicase)
VIAMPELFYLLKNHSQKLQEQIKASEVKRIYNISTPHLALMLLFNDKPFIVVEDSAESAELLYNDISFFRDVFSYLPDSQIDFRLLPLPVLFPPSADSESIGKRAKALYNFKREASSVGRQASSVKRRAHDAQLTTHDASRTTDATFSVITSKDSYRTGFSISNIKDSILNLKKKMEISRDTLQERLEAIGYKNVSVVMEKGEYSRRGWLFDIYPVTVDYPVRIEFFGDEIDVIRTFEIETQRSIKEIEDVEILPAEENEPVHNLIADAAKYTDTEVFIVNPDPSFPLSEHFVSISHFPFIAEGVDSMELSIKGMGILPEERKGLSDIPIALQKTGKNVAAILLSDAQAERLKEIMIEEGAVVPVVERQKLCLDDGLLCISTGNLSSGINLPDILILTGREIFGERPAYRAIKKSKVSRLLSEMDDLKPGDFVVHNDHGIGRFTGIVKQKSEGYEEDLIAIEYLNGKLYIPLHGIERLKKYSAVEGYKSSIDLSIGPAIDKLGGKTWQRTKQRVKKGIQEMAAKLLKLYAERKVVKAYKFSEDTPMHREFDDFFPYEETPDQIKSIEDIKAHMHSEKPMDMLLCGDVGYGKTEVAMKAAFRSVYDGKQVAVAAPTTLLTEQHFRTFKARFSGFPVNIDYVSRFKSKKEIDRTLKALSTGEIDIIIGTHILFNKKITFHDLGLLIIDEEHRFGVSQKERLKDLKKAVDTLTLTATPIPRTLQMSLSGIREMCVIETPPEERLAVRSTVAVFNDAIIKEAFGRELKRGGQVFFVHNRVRDIYKIADYIKKLAADISVSVAHGQMKESELERTMRGFLNREADILVCTAIIGAGLDITTANTIIINRADTFGMSDLYQLRGRVGRGNIQAFAYFLIPGEDIITDDAKKRLKAIQEMSYLGAGFRLALKDLEIRGAGNLLGSEQSGHIYRVGFDMYMEMLEKAVAGLKGEEIREEFDPHIRIRLSAIIPEEYIPDIALRLSLYRRISSVKSMQELSELKDEIADRFGSMPDEIKNLLNIVQVKILARQLYISKVFQLNGKYKFSFLSDAEKKYRVPEGFFDRLLNALFALQKRDKGIRFLPDGFEMDTKEMLSENSIIKAAATLQTLWTRLSK